MTAATRPEDYLGVLQSLTDDGCSYFLEGGQAVNFWAEYFTLREGGVIELEKYQPFTSKDCDLWVSMAAFEHFQAKTDGKLKKGASPADGQLAVFTTDGEPPPQDPQRLGPARLRLARQHRPRFVALPG
jgi:hypothetical protein